MVLLLYSSERTDGRRKMPSTALVEVTKRKIRLAGGAGERDRQKNHPLNSGLVASEKGDLIRFV